jgi:tripartite-type tricarboxylate transporter receptor subunit TctC
MTSVTTGRRASLAAFALAGALAFQPAPAAAFEPTRPIQFIVPAGTGGGADQMARVIQGIVSKHNLSPQPIVVVNKAGAAGAEGFLEAKGAAGNAHTMIISLSNLFTTPIASRLPFSWKDLSPVSMMALDEFILWVHADSGITNVAEFTARAKAGKLKFAGTGSRQEDQIIAVMMQKALGVEFTYVPFRGGGEVATQLVGKHVDVTVNNPIEAVSHWKSGALRPVCVFDTQRLKITDKITATQSWSEIPTCKEQGLDVSYLMLRGIFMPPGVKPAEIAWYVDLLRKVRETPDWQELMKQGAFNTTTMSGNEFSGWLAREEDRHRQLMTEAGFIGATN